MRLKPLVVFLMALSSMPAFAQIEQGGGERTADTLSLSAIKADSIKADGAGTAKSEIPPIRAEGLREAAASLGARAGLASKMHEYHEAVVKREGYFDKIFNFKALMLDVDRDSSPGSPAYFNRPGAQVEAYLVPPVLTEGGPADAYEASGDELRINERMYRIEADAYLSPVPPTWRNYLRTGELMTVEMPHSSLLPKTDAEKRYWNEWVENGWKEGVSQAERIFDAAFARLERDFHGMARWRKAYDQGLAERPKVARSFLGVTGGGREMRINDQIRRITDHSSLNPDVSKWSTDAPE